MVRNAQKKVQDKLNRDETIASYASIAPCRISLDSSLRSINKWLTFGKEYVPLEDSSDLDFSLVDINSVPEIMQVSICHD